MGGDFQVSSQRRIYLASPYSHNDAKIRQRRFDAVCKEAALLMREGALVFSPIAHSHMVASYGLPKDYEFWQNWCMSFLELWATDLVVLKLDGWDKSTGVTAEIEEAKKGGLPITYIDKPERGIVWKLFARMLVRARSI